MSRSGQCSRVRGERRKRRAAHGEHRAEERDVDDVLVEQHHERRHLHTAHEQLVGDRAEGEQRQRARDVLVTAVAPGVAPRLRERGTVARFEQGGAGDHERERAPLGAAHGLAQHELREHRDERGREPEHGQRVFESSLRSSAFITSRNATPLITLLKASSASVRESNANTSSFAGTHADSASVTTLTRNANSSAAVRKSTRFCATAAAAESSAEILASANQFMAAPP